MHGRVAFAAAQSKSCYIANYPALLFLHRNSPYDDLHGNVLLSCAAIMLLYLPRNIYIVLRLHVCHSIELRYISTDALHQSKNYGCKAGVNELALTIDDLILNTCYPAPSSLIPYASWKILGTDKELEAYPRGVSTLRLTGLPLMFIQIRVTQWTGDQSCSGSQYSMGISTFGREQIPLFSTLC